MNKENKVCIFIKGENHYMPNINTHYSSRHNITHGPRQRHQDKDNDATIILVSLHCLRPVHTYA